MLLVLAVPARAATTLNLKDADINTLITTVRRSPARISSSMSASRARSP
jgi:hypothetical protein